MFKNRKLADVVRIAVTPQATVLLLEMHTSAADSTSIGNLYCFNGTETTKDTEVLGR